MSLQIIFLAVFCISFGIIVIHIFKINYKLRENHIAIVNDLLALSQTNQDQIYFRNQNLGCYNFLKYNLEDALIVQNNIQLQTS